MDKKKFVEDFQKKVHDDLYKFLLDKGALDAHLPECPDVADKWPTISRAYIPDGAKEFQEYPVVSLGWMMFIGMALAYYWDTDWEANSKRDDYYEKLKEMDGFDNLDDTVIRKLLGYDGESAEKMQELVAECASRTLSILSHSHIEAGTEEAFGCYIAALHELYLMGMAMELNALGYHMTPYNPASLN